MTLELSDDLAAAFEADISALLELLTSERLGGMPDDPLSAPASRNPPVACKDPWMPGSCEWQAGCT